MHTHALTAAVTLYRSGTITLEQAADSAGLTEASMETTLRSYGIPIRPQPPTSATVDPTVTVP
jgi:predicted HTH domain antitoxin